MKRACTFLLLLILVTYAKEGYEKITIEAPVKCAEAGSLSDVAEEVIAIPLETNNRCLLKHAKLVKRDGNNIFLISKRQLYHFDRSGKFINQITFCEVEHENKILVSDYVINPVRQQLIVIDEEQNVHYYTYDGHLIGKLNIQKNRSWTAINHLSYYNNHLWVTAERIVKHSEEGDRQCLEQWLYKLDTTFNEVEARKLTSAELGRFTLGRNFSPEIAVANKNVYVQSPSMQPDLLLRDTLYLINQNKLDITSTYASILPVRLSGRFLISTYYNPHSTENNYIFCFDQEKDKAYNVKDGFDDNFYGTGKVADLQAMDVHSQSYCYSKTGKEAQMAFPDRKETDNPVLFIVKLKA